MIFWTFFWSNKVISIKNKKGEFHYWILEIRISLGTKFQIKLTILSFGVNLTKKRFSSPKQRKWASPLNSEYLNWSRYQISPQTDNFGFLDIIYPKRVFLIKKKKKKLTSPLNSNIQISLGTKFELKLTFWFFGPNLLKKGISTCKQKKWSSLLHSADSNKSTIMDKIFETNSSFHVK